MLLYKNFFNFNWLCYILIFFLFQHFNNLSNLEVFFKLNWNLAYVSFSSFWWASFNYLYIFWIGLIGLYYFQLNLHSAALLYYMIYYYLNLQIVWQSNCFLGLHSFNLIWINNLLLNNLNKYHPFFLYCGFSGFLLLLLNLINKSSSAEKSFCSIIICSYWLFYQRFAHILIMNFNALILGAWWAQQEGSWGGWWNWDPSENLILIIFICQLFLLHVWSKTYLCIKINFLFYNAIFFFLFWIIYFFLQLNFEFLSHNFGLKFFFFFNNNLFFELVCLFLIWSFIRLLVFFVTLKILCFWGDNFKNIKKLYNLRRYHIEFYLVFGFILFVGYYGDTFWQLNNYFLWTFFSISIDSYTASLFIVNSCFLWSIFFLFKKTKTKNTTLWAIISSCWIFTPWILIFFIKNFFFYSHFLLFVFLVLTKLATTFVYLLYAYTIYFNFYILNFNFIAAGESNFICDYGYLANYKIRIFNYFYNSNNFLINELQSSLITKFNYFFSNSAVYSAHQFNSFFETNEFVFIIINYFLNFFFIIIIWILIFFCYFKNTMLQNSAINN